MIMSIALNLTLCLFRQGLSEPEFYGDLVYKLEKIAGSEIFFSAVH